MNELQIFENSDFGKIRTIMIDNEPYFVGKDVAEILGYENPSVAISKKVDEEDKGISKMETPGGIQNLSIINESGLYSLILSSKLPSAKKFKRWVTSEVLPSIRKNGSYTVPKSFAEALQLAANQAKQIEEMKPKSDFYDKVAGSSDTCDMKEVAKVLNFKNIGRNKLFQILRDEKILDKSNVPYQQFIDAGYFRVIESKWEDQDGDIHINLKTVVYQKGVDYIRKVVIKNPEYMNDAIYGTADSFIDRGETEYNKIINETAERIIEKKYTFKQVASLAGEPLQVISNFSYNKGWVVGDDDTSPAAIIEGYMTEDGYFTEKGKKYIVEVFHNIHEIERMSKKTPYGKAE